MATITDLNTKRTEMNNAVQAYKQALADYAASSITLTQLNDAKATAQVKGDEFAKLSGQVKKDNPGQPEDDFFSNPAAQTVDRRDLVRRANGLNAALVLRLNTEALTTGQKTANFQFKSVGTNVEIDWGDGTVQTATGPIAHTYATAGVYDVEIRGAIHGFDPRLASMREVIQDVLQWGTTEIHSATNMFYDCDSLTVLTATDGPNFQPGASCELMFYGCANFNDDISHWDTSNVVSMRSMFQFATAFNSPLNGWDTSAVTDMYRMFGNAEVFNQPLDQWSTGNVTDMRYMFTSAYQFNSKIDTWDVSSVFQFGRMFENANSFNQPLAAWNTIGAGDMYRMFYSANVFNQDISGWNVSGVTTAQDFRTLSALSSVNSPF